MAVSSSDPELASSSSCLQVNANKGASSKTSLDDSLHRASSGKESWVQNQTFWGNKHPTLHHIILQSRAVYQLGRGFLTFETERWFYPNINREKQTLLLELQCCRCSMFSLTYLLAKSHLEYELP